MTLFSLKNKDVILHIFHLWFFPLSKFQCCTTSLPPVSLSSLKNPIAALHAYHLHSFTLKKKWNTCTPINKPREKKNARNKEEQKKRSRTIIAFKWREKKRYDVKQRTRNLLVWTHFYDGNIYWVINVDYHHSYWCKIFIQVIF